ncbi:MAG: NAD(P)H-dependent oxidoreductase, partial [Croceibacterium sp.]
MQILRIDTAVTGAESVSRELTQALTDHFLAQNPDATVVEHDFGSAPLAHIDPVTMGAIRFPADKHSDAMAAAHPAERAVLDEFLASDIVIVGAPMYNFSIPSPLKAWLDRLG